MLALIAGTGGLPAALLARLETRPLVCAMRGFEPSVPVDLPFRIEHLGSLLKTLAQRGVDAVCFAGAISRPGVDEVEIDAETAPLVPRIVNAIAQGDDAALRIVISIFEEFGITVVGAHEIAPNLLPNVGVPTKAKTAQAHSADASAGELCVASLGATDTGQACIVRAAQVVATEGPDGTAAMMENFGGSTRNVGPGTGKGGILFKAPKPDQDRRADLPLIGPETAQQAANAGLAGIVIEVGGVMVLDLQDVLRILDEKNMFLWVRPRGGV